jgi:hypothetical protein
LGLISIRRPNRSSTTLRNVRDWSWIESRLTDEIHNWFIIFGSLGFTPILSYFRIQLLTFFFYIWKSFFNICFFHFIFNPF